MDNTAKDVVGGSGPTEEAVQVESRSQPPPETPLQPPDETVLHHPLDEVTTDPLTEVATEPTPEETMNVGQQP